MGLHADNGLDVYTLQERVGDGNGTFCSIWARSIEHSDFGALLGNAGAMGAI